MLIFKNPKYSTFDINLVEYDFSWDYDLIDIVELNDINFIKTIVKKLQSLEVSWASNYAIDFIDIDELGLYVSGTHHFPHIGICINDIKKLATNYEKQLFLTIVHELYHAEQERNGQEFDCDEAELMANDLYFRYKNL